jgi:site-specific DNA recombinase
MTLDLPAAGGASDELAFKVQLWWREEAIRANIDISTFDPHATLERRLRWAMEQQLEIAGALSRYSSKLQHSTEAQLRQMVEFAAWHKMYLPSEFICVDEAKAGRRLRRDGLDRMKMILERKLIKSLLLFKLSRLLRVGYRSFQFVQENVVEEGMRAISVSQGIDTADTKTWRSLMYLHGMMDDLLLQTMADHCRAGLESMFLDGYTTGALSVGFKAVPVPGAPLTNRGLPRTRPATDKEVAELILQHYEWIRDGMSVQEGWRRWVKSEGPCDPRSTLGYMSNRSYRRMLSNSRNTGLWAFGRKRNQWSSKRDYNLQIDQPDTEIKFVRSEELRIISDELFLAVQARLAKNKKGPQGPRKKKPKRLWDLTTSLFFCASCSTTGEPIRFHQTGCRGEGMQCKRRDLCTAKGSVRREAAVRAICAKLQELMENDSDFVKQVIARVCDRNSHEDEDLVGKIKDCTQREQSLSQQIVDLWELAGQGTDEDRKKTKARVRAAQSERTECQLSRLRFEQVQKFSTRKFTPDDVKIELRSLCDLLDDAVAGRLGEDAIYKAVSIFERLVGGIVWVHLEKRPGRKSKIVRATFRPNLLAAFSAATGLPTLYQTDVVSELPEVEVWLRPPPYLDQMATEAYVLIDVKGHSYRGAANVFQKRGHNVNSGKVWQFRKRYFEMLGQQMPKRPIAISHRH